MLADVVYGRSYAKYGRWNATMVDVISTIHEQIWQMEHHCGRYYGHIVVSVSMTVVIDTVFVDRCCVIYS